ncbi:MAG: glycosyltransferase family 4 protein, partial [Candidatus Bathyarchaeota archaeon]
FSYRKRKPQFTSRGIAVRGLTWKYGVDIAIKAYSNLKGTSLAILGTGSLEDYMRNLAQRCRSNVTFLSKHVKHSMMPSLYKEYGYFVAPSRTEAQGVAMCEAMACGVPPIAARVGGIPDFVKDGINGMLIPPENPVALRKAIKRLLVDDQLYATLSVNGAKYMRANLSHKEIYRKEHRILRMCQERFTPKS